MSLCLDVSTYLCRYVDMSLCQYVASRRPAPRAALPRHKGPAMTEPLPPAPDSSVRGCGGRAIARGNEPDQDAAGVQPGRFGHVHIADHSELYPHVVRRRAMLGVSYGEMRARAMSAVDRHLAAIREIDLSLMDADFVLAMLQPRRTGTRRIEWRRDRDGIWYVPSVVRWISTRRGLSRYERIAPAAVVRTVPFRGLAPIAREMVVETLESVIYMFVVRARLRSALLEPERAANLFDSRTRSALKRHQNRIANFKTERLEDRALHRLEHDLVLIRELGLDD